MSVGRARHHFPPPPPPAVQIPQLGRPSGHSCHLGKPRKQFLSLYVEDGQADTELPRGSPLTRPLVSSQSLLHQQILMDTYCGHPVLSLTQKNARPCLQRPN